MAKKKIKFFYKIEHYAQRVKTILGTFLTRFIVFGVFFASEPSKSGGKIAFFLQKTCLSQKKTLTLQPNFKNATMTTLQMDADLLRNLGIIAEDESMLEKVAKYVRKLVKQMANDPTRMTKEEYFAMLDEAEAQYARGEYTVQQPGESVEDMLKRCGYDL